MEKSSENTVTGTLNKSTAKSHPKSLDYVLNITLMGLMTALTCILAPLSIQLPGQVPISLTLMVIYLTVYLIGGAKGTGCCALYLLIGLIGLTVFSGYTGGIGKLAGPTGGYLIGFIFTAAMCGLFLRIGKGNIWIYMIGMILGCAVAYAFGSVWFMISMPATFKETMAACVIPFLPFDAAKIAAIMILGPIIKKLLHRVDGLQNVIAY